MSLYRRLFIDTSRINLSLNQGLLINLLPNEIHYLSRVIRLRTKELFEVTDGEGGLWIASFETPKQIKLQKRLTSKPLLQSKRTLIGIAVAIPKQDFDYIIRMSCEIGIDLIQPLLSKRGVVKQESKERRSRWNSILRESVEQSERLWMPKICDTKEYIDWISSYKSPSNIAIGISRIDKSLDFSSWMNSLEVDVEVIWIAIGPEGGWSPEEIKLAKESGCGQVQFGDFIMRTSTAAVVASHIMASWRTNELRNVI